MIGVCPWVWMSLLILFACGSSFDLATADDIVKHTPTEPRRPVHLLAVLIGGIESDPTPAQISGTAAKSGGPRGYCRHDFKLKIE